MGGGRKEEEEEMELGDRKAKLGNESAAAVSTAGRSIQHRMAA